jgi:hypothetical protein
MQNKIDDQENSARNDNRLYLRMALTIMILVVGITAYFYLIHNRV